MLILIAILLGIVEGLTEFLPVSSTGHLIVIGHALDFRGDKASTFQIFIQLGAILAVTLLYRQRIARLLQFGKSSAQQGLQGKRGLSLIALTTLPAVIFGLLLYDFIKANLFQPLTVAIGLFVGGVIILIFEAKHPEPTITSLDDITPRQALGVGIAQLAALWPGVSRAGSTIIGGVLCGLDRKTAVEYSFLIAIPVMFAATGYDLLKGIMAGNVVASDFPLFATGFIAAFIAAALAVRYLVTFVQRYSFRPFGWYRIILSIIIVLVLV